MITHCRIFPSSLHFENCHPLMPVISLHIIQISLYLKVNKASAHEKNMDVGANIFVGNLDPEVDEKLLFDTFSAFGVILQVSHFWN